MDPGCGPKVRLRPNRSRSCLESRRPFARSRADKTMARSRIRRVGNVPCHHIRCAARRIISPLLLNVALHGLQNYLGSACGYIRYADDLIVYARSRTDIETAQSKIEGWLQPRGLVLHPEKTRIVHIDDGFNFLGFSVRRYKGKCLIKPQNSMRKINWAP